MSTAKEIIMGVVTDDWQKATTVAQNIKLRNPFRGSYTAVVSQMYDLAREGLVEVKHERTGKAGPQTRFVRRKR
ncbi:hypothetical protein [Rhizobium phage RHph_X3_2]|nr:hypothetical protein [Rhizobium phage RHph_X3_2]